MINPVTDKKFSIKSRTLGFCFTSLYGLPSEANFGWKNMVWDRNADPSDWTSDFIRQHTGFRIVRNKS